MANPSIYLIRHGIAEDRDRDLDDVQRSLTPEGIKKTRQVAKRLLELGLQFDLLQSSPLVRARQTAEIFIETFAGCPLQVTPTLSPGGDFDAWLNWFLEWRQSESRTVNRATDNLSLGLIGHEPDLSAWAELLIWGEARGILVLKKAGVIGLALPASDPPVGQSLLFLLAPPKILVP